MKRFYFIWFLALTLGALAVAGIQSTIESSHLQDDADARAWTLLSSLDDSVQLSYRAKHFGKIAKTIDRLRAIRGHSEKIADLSGLVICPQDDASSSARSRRHKKSVSRTRFPRSFPLGSGWEGLCENPLVAKASADKGEQSWGTHFQRRKLKFYARAMNSDENRASEATLVLVQDLSPLRTRWVNSFIRSFLVYWLGGLLILVLIATQLRRWLQDNLQFFRQTLRSLIQGRRPKSFPGLGSTVESALQPISRDIDELAKKILTLSSRQERKKKQEQGAWLADLKHAMGDRKLLVIANREPYIHNRIDGQIKVVRPASGLVTALEPVLRQCGGMWIAHGGGSADRETADAQGIVAVPPESERYKLKRVWLSPEEEEGYYYGFSNEGVWPLCHLAHTRPTFRLTDWTHYHAVNRKFSEAIPAVSFTESSVLLVQDYHFALLPQMIKQRAKQLGTKAPKVGLFWHIPWPNPEAFGICPWNTELLRGMLGADVVGFHTQYHCNNFLETCNRYLEARIDYERFSVTMENHETFVRAFPIGIDTSPVRTLTDEEVQEIKARYGIKAEKVAVGVDRLDYTKGLVERVEAVERFLEKNPEWIGRFSFVQMGSPSRTHIPAYQNLAQQLEQTVERVNLRFSRQSSDPDYKPVILLSSHHQWEEIQYFYQMGDICLVTSLHDGMNLVAKEYIWCQSPHRGSLILSKFAGASRELNEAFIVNPYSIEEMANAISAALSLSHEERTARMRSMKDKVEGRNAFHWASDLIKAVVETDEGLQVNISEPERFAQVT
jgi:trehalose 6-phosphate synthase